MKLNSLIFSLVATLTLVGCDDQLQVELTYVAEQSRNGVTAVTEKVNISLAELCSDVTVPSEDGQMVRGTRDCTGTTKVCQKVGDTGCTMADRALYGIDPKDLKPGNIKAGVQVGNVTGSYVANGQDCAADGAGQCLATADFPAVKISEIATKVLKGQAIGSHQGQFEPDLPPASAVRFGASTGGQAGTIADCTSAATVGCIVPATHAATAPATITAGNIKKDAIINGVTGSFRTASPVCAADGAANCLVEGTFKAIDSARVVSTNLEDGYDVLTTRGSVKAKPSNCTADGATACVAHGTFAAIDASTLAAGKIRRGVTIGGVTGDYPSANHPITGAQSAVNDLQNGNFSARLASPDTFEYWDANGVRYTGTGTADLKAANILTTKSLFGIQGGLITSHGDCSEDNQQNCVATTSHPAIKKALLSESQIRSGVTIAGVQGKYPSLDYPLDGKGGNTDLDFPANVDGNHSVVFWDAEGNPQTVAAAPDLEPTNILATKSVLGVAGSATGSPADCGTHNQTGCVAKAGFPSYEASRLTAENIKKGVDIAGPSGTVTGAFPSAAAPFRPTATGAKKLTSSNFNSSIASAQSFEFWDSTGAMHTHQGDADFTAANLLKDVTAFGVTGTYQAQPADCSATKVTDCVATATRPTYDSATLTADKIKAGEKIGAITGTYPSATAPLAGSTAMADLKGGSFNSQVSSATSFEYWDSSGQRFTAVGDPDIAVAANIRSATTILGNGGSQPETPDLCTGELQADCVAKTDYKTVDVSRIDAKNIKANTNILGVTGSYPSATNRLPDSSAVPNLTTGNWNASVASNAEFEFWNSAGEVKTAKGSSLLVAGNIKSGEAVFGVDGSVTTTSGDCSTPGQLGCTATASFPSYDKVALKPEVIKDGEQILGVTGDYISATRPMPDGGFAGSTLSANFNNAIRSNSAFQFWDSNGVRHEANGDSDIQAANLRTGVNAFGVSGSVTPYPEIDPWDVLYDETYIDSSGTQKTGKMKVNCRNMTDSDSGEAWSSTTTVSNYRNIDDYNNGRNRMPNQNPFLNDAYKCNGDAFMDVSRKSSDNSLGTCGDTGVKCIFKDRIAKLLWQEVSFGGARKTYSQAMTECQNSTVGGFNNWRLPTQKEALMAYVHGIRDVSLRLGSNSGRYRVNNFTWTSTYDSKSRDTYTGVYTDAYAVEMVQGISRPQSKSILEMVHCVHDN